MGNIITNDDGTIIDSKLNDIISDWAINNFDAGLNYKRKGEPINKLLLKRACCIKSPDMTIALPNFILDDTDDIRKFDTTYTPVTIKNVYDEDKYNETCNNIDGEENADYRQPPGYQNATSPGATDAVTMTSACKILYEGEGLDLGLCHHIKTNRAKQTTDENVIAYGSNDILNVYSDCNCLNSVLRKNNPKLVINGQEQYNPNILVQMLDPKCSIDNVYNYKLETVENICINSNDIGNIDVSDTAKVTVLQNCIINNNQETSNSTSPPIPTPTPTPISTSTSIPTPTPTPISTPISTSTPTSIPTSIPTSTSVYQKIVTPTNIIILVSTIVITSLVFFIMYKYFVH